MKAKFGAFLFGAAIFSFFFPRRRPASEPPARPPQSPPPDRLYALLQTKPEARVLAISASAEELEREIAELHETWNHWAVRNERLSFEIHLAPLLAVEPANAADRLRKPPGAPTRREPFLKHDDQKGPGPTR